jgi:hypothetical protein
MADERGDRAPDAGKPEIRVNTGNVQAWRAGLAQHDNDIAGLAIVSPASLIAPDPQNIRIIRVLLYYLNR